MKYFLGIDLGSSKTHALIVDETGQCVGFERSGSGNHQTVGYDGLAHVVRESFERAREMSGVTAASITGAGFGGAGVNVAAGSSNNCRGRNRDGKEDALLGTVQCLVNMVAGSRLQRGHFRL